MNATVTRRIATAVTGPAVLAAVLSGAVALGAPARAETAAKAQTCTAVKVVATPVSVTNLLTRPGQLDAVQAPPRRGVPVISCLEGN